MSNFSVKNCVLTYNKKLTGSLFVVFSFMLLSFMTVKFFAPDLGSNAATQNASETVGPYTLSMSNDSVANVDITPTASQQIFTTTNNLTLSNSCSQGATISISTNSETSNDLTRNGIDSATKTIPATTGSSLLDNTWGFSTDGGTTYNPVPMKGGTATYVYDAVEAATNKNIPVQFGIKTDSSLPSGTYTTDVVYTASVKSGCLTYSLAWDLNGGTGKSGTSYATTNVNWGTTFNLTNYTPTRDGYTFTGWSNGSSTFTGNETAADLNSGNLNSTTMTAQWTPSFYTITYMQEMTDLICSTVQTPVSTATTSVTIDTYPTYGLSTSYVPETTLTDSRDNETYRIRKLSDGNCWMTENLRLGNSSNQITITASDSNTNGDFVLPVAQTATTGYWSNASNSTNTKKIYQNSNTSYGNYYNWYTATAGSGTASITAANTDVSYSICAKGWRLPTDRNIAKSYYKLGLAYNSSYTYGRNNNNTRLLSFPLNFVISGGYNYSGQKVDWQEVYGLYWTSTNYNGTIAYDMDLSYSYTYFHDTGTTDKAYGWTIRCVNI